MSPADTPEPPPTPGTGDVWWEVIDACDAFLPGYHDDAAWTAWRKAGGMLDTSTTPEPPGLRRERVECVLTAPELARLDALRGHESRSHFLLIRAGVRAEPATAPACPGREPTP